MRLPSALPRLSLFVSTAPAALAAIARHAPWADVVHGHGHLPALYHGWRRFFGGRKPYVLHLHITAAGRREQSEQRGRGLDWWTDHFEWPLHQLSDRWGCLGADAILCTSESVRQEAIRFCGADPGKIMVLPNGVNTATFSPAGPDARTRLGFVASDKIMLFVGALTRRKRVDLLLEALAHLPPEWKLLIVGRGQESAALGQQARILGLASRVRFHGYVPYPELPALYRSTDVLVLPSQYEGCPKVVLEALACGLPVVARGFELTQPTLRAAIEWFGALGDAQELAGLIVRAVKRSFRGVSSASISWLDRAHQVQRLYERLLGDTRTPGR